MASYNTNSKRYGSGHATGPRTLSRKTARDNIRLLSKASIKKLARRGGIKRVRKSVYETTHEALRYQVTKVIENIVARLAKDGRTTATTLDVLQSIKITHGFLPIAITYPMPPISCSSDTPSSAGSFIDEEEASTIIESSPNFIAPIPQAQSQSYKDVVMDDIPPPQPNDDADDECDFEKSMDHEDIRLGLRHAYERNYVDDNDDEDDDESDYDLNDFVSNPFADEIEDCWQRIETWRFKVAVATAEFGSKLPSAFKKEPGSASALGFRVGKAAARVRGVK